jgi:hypothetical protein
MLRRTREIMRDAIYHIREACVAAVALQASLRCGTCTKKAAEQGLLEAFEQLLTLYDYVIWNPDKCPPGMMYAILLAGSNVRKAIRVLRGRHELR